MEPFEKGYEWIPFGCRFLVAGCRWKWTVEEEAKEKTIKVLEKSEKNDLKSKRL